MSYDKLMDMILNSNYIVVLSGAGISTAADIPDFRGPYGFYNDPNVKAESVFDINEFKNDPSIHAKHFADFYAKMVDANPTKGHLMLKKIEDMGKLKSVITQNIDGLHQKAGSSNVIEVHGNIREYVCLNSPHHRVNSKDIEDKIKNGEVIKCTECDGTMKASIVFFGEHVQDLEKALTEIQKADLILVLGTSLTVYPVAGLPEYRKDHTKLVIINDQETSYDYDADLVLRDKIDTIVEKLGLVK